MNKNWWHNKIIYQIYPQSFYDSNADGIGDLNGIIEKLDYIKELGIDIIWISPIFCSPMKDNGYDISDYYSIAPQYGIIGDLEKLIIEAKKRKIKILLDLVVNHCSDKHEWFQKALNDPESEWGQYFIIKKGNNGKPPNNWRAIFGGSVWEQIRDTKFYYYHTFTKNQPDFNWENKDLRYEIYEMINFWLNKGISGFRIDAITFIKKELTFTSLEPDGPDGLVALRKVGVNYPGIEVFLKEMKKETFEKYNAFSIAEMSSVGTEKYNKYIGDDGFYDSIFDFSIMNLDLAGTNLWIKHKKFNAEIVNRALFESQKKAQEINAFLSIVLENHDQPRSLNKWFKQEEISFYSASLLAVLNTTIRGVPIIYQGQEIGMTNREWSSIGEIKDVKSIGQYKLALINGASNEEAFDAIKYRTRDNARSPMQWTNKENGGFTTGKAWTSVNKNFNKINVEEQLSNEQSLLQFYKRVIQLRKSENYENIFWLGTIKQIYPEKKNLIAYEREYNQRKVHIILNYSSTETQITNNYNSSTFLIHNYQELKKDENSITLRAFESIIVEYME